MGDNEEGSFTITGGYESSTTNRVTKYYRDGSYEDMPTLNTARDFHACGCYMNTNQQKVYLVVAGMSASNSRIKSTEILVSGSSSWRTITATYPISAGASGLRAISINNAILAFGGYSTSYVSNIYEFNPA